MKYHDDDLVILIVVTNHNHVSFSGVTRKWATETMRNFWINHQALQEIDNPEVTNEDKRNATHYLSTGALASNYANENWKEGDQTWCRAVVPWKEVVGMYIREIEKEEWQED